MKRYQHSFGSAVRAFVATVAIAAIGTFAASAQERVTKTDEGEYAYDFKIFFPFDVAEFSANYLENPETLAKLDSVFSVHGTDMVDSLLVIAQSSPEGSYAHNVDLSNRRAASMNEYLISHYPGLAGKIKLAPGIAPWPNPRSKAALVRLRYAAFRLVFPYDITVPVPAVEDIDDSLYAIDIPEEAVAIAPLAVDLPDSEYKQMIFALKTNLLYDAVTALNFEIEVPIGKRFSFMWEDVFPWWETGNKYCFQHWEMGAEARYWFKPWDPRGVEKLRGFFVGPYLMSAKYDFQNDRSLDYQGEYWSAGLSAGWATALGRKKWCNLELSLSLGYLNTDYRGYIPADDYSLLIRNPYDVGNASYFGPTKAKVSFVLPINITRKAGGSK